MKYRSTRDSRGEHTVSLARAIRLGFPEDGGLYIPTRIMALNVNTFSGTNTFRDFAGRFMELCLDGDFVDPGNAFEIDVPLVPLGGEYKGIYVLELFHGPTGAFKDIGSRWIARAMRQLLSDAPTILVATSGDTGSAVADAYSSQTDFHVVLLYPRNGVSHIQEQQLCTPRRNVSVYRVDGPFNKCDELVDHAFLNLRHLEISTANSINVGRLIPQISYYFWAAHMLSGAPPAFFIPSGNLGNLTAGLYASKMGLPNVGFVAAQNANNYLERFVKRGELVEQAVVSTLSNAMDISHPQNLERIRFLFEPDELRELLSVDSFSDRETREEMQRAFFETGYLADPHTALALRAARLRLPSPNPVVVVGTAHPAKYPELVRDVTGQSVEPPASMAFDDGTPEAELISANFDQIEHILSSIEKV